jgi:hypothetical protein
MNDKISKLAEELRQAIIESTNEITVSASIFINSQGCNFEINERSPESLKQDGISMRNLKGDFIS